MVAILALPLECLPHDERWHRHLGWLCTVGGRGVQYTYPALFHCNGDAAQGQQQCCEQAQAGVLGGKCLLCETTM